MELNSHSFRRNLELVFVLALAGGQGGLFCGVVSSSSRAGGQCESPRFPGSSLQPWPLSGRGVGDAEGTCGYRSGEVEL